MADSSIEWTDKTWNPVTGCTHVSAGCDSCYAVTMTNRLEAMGQAKYSGLTVLNGKGDRHFNGQVRFHDESLDIPMRWKNPRRIFVNSMSDLFHKDVPFEFVDKVFAVMALCPQHTFQILTKRPERMAEYLRWREPTINRQGSIQNQMDFRTARIDGFPRRVIEQWPLPNVWLGTSVENQDAADKRIPHLLGCSAAVRFLSIEPLLGPVNIRLNHEVLTDILDLNPDRDPRHRGTYPFSGIPNDSITRRHHLLDWIIVGCESGPNAREMKTEWAESVRDQCSAAGVSFFMKQMKVGGKVSGEPNDFPESLRVREFPSPLSAKGAE